MSTKLLYALKALIMAKPVMKTQEVTQNESKEGKESENMNVPELEPNRQEQSKSRQ